jgi:hypothetical protein
VNLAARSSIAVLVEIGCYTVVDLSVSAGSSDCCEGNGSKLHFCYVLVCCCVLGFCIEEKEDGLTGFVHEKFSGVFSRVCTRLVISSKSLVLPL